MNGPQEAKALVVFDAVCNLPEPEQKRVLETRCVGNEALRTLVERMLDRDKTDRERALLPGLGAELIASEISCETEPGPDSIAGFRVIREIGRGGMGVVYEAEQTEPSRRVAVKVIREGIASSEVVSRFRREADLLGRLQHPGVAHVYESGFDSLGRRERPYFAMEYVDGLPLDEHADRHGLDTAQRVELIARVCDAVHHAHQKGILHRDLKSANILVAAHDDAHGTRTLDLIGQPKVLDFGIARLAEETDAVTLHTHAGQVIGSLACMSPEQLAGDRDLVDTRTDVYSIGVMLYRLLAGRQPRELTGLSVPEALRVVIEHTPPSLSTIDPGLRGDISVIAAKALQIDPELRYESVAMLAEDLRRTLRDEPISAQPASRWYRFKKFTKRHRSLVGVASSAVVLLAAATVVSIFFAIRADRTADRERLAADRADRAAYHASISAASAAVRDGDARLARVFLSEAPQRYRGWEWHYFDAELDTSTASARLTPVDRVQDAMKFLGAACWTSPDGSLVRIATYEAKRRDFETFGAGTLAQLGAWSAGPDSRPLGRSEDGSRVFVYHIDAGGVVTRDLTTGALLDEAKAPPALGVAESYDILGPGDAQRVLSFSASARGRFGWLGVYSPDRSQRASFAGVEPEIIPLHAGDPLVSFGPFRESIRGAAFAPDGEHIAYVSLSRDVAVFDAHTGEPRWWHTDGHGDAAMCVVYSPDGGLIATGSQDRTIRLWDAETGEPIARMIGHENAVVGLGFNPTGEILYSADATTLKSWKIGDAIDAGVVVRHDWFVRLLSASNDGKQLVVCSEDCDVFVYSLDEPGVPRPIELPPLVRKVAGLAFTEDGHIILLADLGREGEFRSEILVIDPDAMQPALALGLAKQLGMELVDSNGVIRGDFDLPNILHTISDTATEQSRAEASGDPVHQHGRLLLQTGHDSVSLYDSRGRVEAEWQTLGSEVIKIAVDVESDRGYAATKSGEIHVLDLGNGTLIGSMDGGAERIECLAVHPDGSRLFGGSGDTTIRVWDTETLQLVAVLRGHRDTVRDLSFTEDGETLYSASDDYTVRSWAARTDRPPAP